MRPTHENVHTAALTTPGRDPASRRRRTWRLGAPTAAVIAVLAAALIGSGLNGGAATAAGTTTSQTQVATATQAQVAAATSTSATALSAKTAATVKAQKRVQAQAKAQAQLKRLAKKYPRKAAKKMMKNRGYSARQSSCLIKLWNKESGWRWYADNPSSSAYGIPQALPGRKMASAGRDWRTNPVTQIKWGLKYIKSRHGSPCGAWNHSRRTGWY